MVELQTKEKRENLDLLERPPVVAMMGHVDHGKTSLLDAIRGTKVAEKEYGGITQHTNAYQLAYKGQLITFIDTPGHAAFSQMRARGAKVTDLVILVVAADDGVMPQTKESIAHIKASGVPFIVAVNKIDLPGADINKIKQQLSENGVLVEGFGGEVVLVPVSAKTKSGLEDLLEMIILVSQIVGLKNESKNDFQGVIIESSLDRYRGPLAVVLVQAGELKIGDEIVAGAVKGKVRAIRDSEGKVVSIGSVSSPLEVLGFESVPAVGELVREKTLQGPLEKEEKKPLGRVLDWLQDKEEFRLVIKADVQGSVEAVTRAIEELETPNSKISILLKETGDITESDVYLAKSSDALILGFNVKILPPAQRMSQEEKVPIRTYNIIYELLDECKLGIEALVKKEEKEIKAKAKVLALFETSAGKVIGAKVSEGEFKLGENIYLIKDEEESGTAKIISMRQRQEDIKLAKEGEEFGLQTKPALGVAVGDIIATYADK